MRTWLLMPLLCLACRPEAPTQATPSAPPSRTATVAEGGGRIVTLYYAHRSRAGLYPVQREIIDHPLQVELVKQVIDYLSIPADDPDAVVVWPSSTHVREVFLLSDGQVVVDFDGHFLSGLAYGIRDEEFMIASLVNSILINFPEYKSVRILIDGEQQESFLGHIDIESPLDKRVAIPTIARDLGPDPEPGPAEPPPP